MDERVVGAVGRHAGIDDWTLRHHRARGTQIYLVGDAVESVRRVGRELYEVEVVNDHAADGEPRRGATTVRVGPNELGDLDGRLDEAVAMAGRIHNPPWALPEPVIYPEVPLADPALVDEADWLGSARSAMDLIRDLTEGAVGVRVSAAELFITVVDEEIANSRGLRGTGTASSLLLELALLAERDGIEVEYFRSVRARRLEDLRLPDVVAQGIGYARDAIGAGVPVTRAGPVVIRGFALEQLLGGGVLDRPPAYLDQAGAAAAYEESSPFELGAAVYGGAEPTGDLLTLRSDARRPYGGLAYRFDDDGLPARDLLVVEDGILKARPATLRYAQYLGLPASGRHGLVTIAPGPTPLADLIDDGPVLEVLAFSSHSVDALTGNFGMEIRVGYEHAHGERRPVKGGSVSGNLFAAMAAARFSAETDADHSRAGAAAIRFEALQVTGSD